MAGTAFLAGIETPMTTMTALEAKNAFGRFLDAVQRAPVTVTKNGREVGVMISMADLEAIGKGFLMEPIRQEVRSGELTLGEALLKQAWVNRGVEEAD